MKKCGTCLTVIVCVFALLMLYAADVQQNLSNNLLRMHIIANSNSLCDQGIKLSVRNSILEEMRENTDINKLEETADRELEKLGADYGARVSVEECYVPEKEYKNIRLPEGMYNCIKVVLGSGSGENWWCVAYPPLCYTEEMFGEISLEGKTQLELALDDEALKTIVKNGDVSFRFKIVEEMQKLRKNLQKTKEGI